MCKGCDLFRLEDSDICNKLFNDKSLQIKNESVSFLLFLLALLFDNFYYLLSNPFEPLFIFEPLPLLEAIFKPV